MLPSREQLDGIVSALGKYISLVRAYHMEETAVLLNMARLDLQMKIHSISDSELQALCDVLESKYSSPAADHNGSDSCPHPARPAATKTLPLPITNPVNGILLEPHATQASRKRSGRALRRPRKGP
jgi:hypothetical protein